MLTHYLPIVGLIGRLTMLFALLMGVPLAFAVAGHDEAEWPFVVGAIVTLACGLVMTWSTRRARRELQPRDGFILVTLAWSLLPAFAAIPLKLALPGLSLTDAYFEAMSGFTTTGATVLTGLDALPLSVNVWRCFLSLVGGLGIIVLAIAILPLLGVGGTQLFKAESAGPLKDQKLTPRIADTARGLWLIYFGVAVAMTLAYRAAGMSWADAFMHMCTTVSAGGFSSHDASFGYWNSPRLEAVAIVGMMLAGASWALYFVAVHRRSPSGLWRNGEFRGYWIVIGAGVAVATAYLFAQGQYPAFWSALRYAAFHVVSIATTTGYASTDYALWPGFVPWLMLLLGCFATCAGSTGGGIKMVRFLLLLKQARKELVRIVHPHVYGPITFAGAVVSERIMHSVIAFMMMYGAVLVGLTLLLLFSGMEPVSAFTAIVACLNSIGPGLGSVGPAGNFQGLSDFQTWVCSAAMMLGRLELLAVLVLLTPQFWRR
ncbi:MAG: TrkH family potassium uptake protein [Rhodoferax sp.]|jgi:trk system potassium uptake protein TrkH|nr:TrkH family potassium uptake protein [Rhodoferax sp.]